MPKDFKRSTRHHCPLKNGSKGNCRRLNGYCSAHQIKCMQHSTIHLRGEPCMDCQREAQRMAEEAANASADTKDESKSKNKKVKK
ncbi:hypothetical protein F5Y00DRAFT_265230 [Daldinia vernicosa]|uniref:uncharacterized protein n=1 Tax=Daldinia vernicosa TaxID=114800 RepID=UPI0020074171|nr:uncharacterized protein F5Y00DRAFT_265230 [Daldinia vernicosa]KAI0845749.1 hypothetical protein F5Y00DRAFT_265230 [Daldinia vernicosa]